MNAIPRSVSPEANHQSQNNNTQFMKTTFILSTTVYMSGLATAL